MSAELQERQKQVIEAEKKTLAIRQKLQQTVQKAEIYNREGRKAQFTEVELKTVPDDRVVYKAIGKMFVERPCADLVKEMQTKQDTCKAEVEKCIGLEKTLNTSLEEAEADFEKLYKQFIEEAKLLQSAQQQK